MARGTHHLHHSLFRTAGHTSNVGTVLSVRAKRGTRGRPGRNKVTDSSLDLSGPLAGSRKAHQLPRPAPETIINGSRPQESVLASLLCGLGDPVYCIMPLKYRTDNPKSMLTFMVILALLPAYLVRRQWHACYHGNLDFAFHLQLTLMVPYLPMSLGMKGISLRLIRI